MPKGENRNYLPEELRQVGTIAAVGQQTYRLVRFEPHRTKTGNLTELAIWRSTCPACGAEFKTTERTNQYPTVRRCSEHRSPGKRVEGRLIRRFAILAPDQPAAGESGESA